VDESDHLTLVNAGDEDSEVVSQEEGERGRGAPQREKEDLGLRSVGTPRISIGPGPAGYRINRD